MVSLKGKIEDKGKTIEKIKKIAASAFNRLFIPTISYKPVEGFREGANTILTKAEASQLIKLCQVASSPRVSFETTGRDAV